MIEINKNVEIKSTPGQFDRLCEILRHHIGGPWHFIEIGLVKHVPDGKAAVFEYSGKLPEARLALSWWDGKAQISNIVPKRFGELTVSEYNQLFDSFYKRVLSQAVGDLHLDVKVSGGNQDISNWLKPDAIAKLNAFSALANRGSGSSHPADHQRWIAFILATHKEKANLPVNVLRRWLIEVHHWPETIAIDLVSEYENALELLVAYDAER